MSAHSKICGSDNLDFARWHREKCGNQFKVILDKGLNAKYRSSHATGLAGEQGVNCLLGRSHAMRKCNYCGLENQDEATQCRICHSDLVAVPESLTLLNMKSLKKLLPYFLSYVIVATGAWFFLNYSFRTPFPTHAVILQTKLPASELTAKLEQIGVPKDDILQPITLTPKIYGGTLVIHFAIYGIILAAFAVLLRLFQNKFRESSSDHRTA
jgi:hypothetical protein